MGQREKATPEEALLRLREEVEKEIIKSREKDGGVKGYFTAIYMSRDTYCKLCEAVLSSDGIHPIRGHYSPELIHQGYDVVSSLRCDKFVGYIIYRESLPMGKVIIKRCHYKPLKLIRGLKK